MSKDSFPIDAAQIVGLFMESVFYGQLESPAFLLGLVIHIFLYTGIYLVSFFSCMRVLLWTEGWFKPAHMLNKKMLIAALLMFTFATMDVAFHLRHNLEAFVYFDTDPILTFDQTSNWINVMKMVSYVLQTFVGDAILLYRCWVVYGKNWFIVALPAVLWIGTTVCGAMTIYVEATINNTNQLLNASSLVPFITSMLCLTLATNVSTTGLIVHRIWKIRGSLKHRSNVVVNSPLTNVLVVLVESGLMYTASIIILFGLYMASNNGQYGVSNAVVQIIGITFNLIITSVDRGESTQTMPYSGRSHLSQQASHGTVPLHMINIQTTVSHYPDQGRSPTGKSSDIEMENSSTKQEWETR